MTKTILNVLFTLLIITSAGAQNSQQSIYQSITQTENGSIRIEADLEALQRNKKTDNLLPAVLHTEDGKSFHVKLLNRGRFRRNLCKYPPMRIIFSREELSAASLDTFSEMKLVMPYSYEKSSDKFLVKEYLTYRMYESLTPYHIKARMVNLVLKDTRSNQELPMTSFLVESKAETMSRLNAVSVEAFGLTPDSLDQEQYALTAMFQHMIGNMDWDISSCRNVRMAKLPTSNKLYPIPYDFDFSGLVNAAYARPATQYGLVTVQDRKFMGSKLPKSALRAATAKLMAARPTFMALCKSALLGKQGSEEMEEYLQSFFSKVRGKGDVPMTIYFEK